MESRGAKPGNQKAARHPDFERLVERLHLNVDQLDALLARVLIHIRHWKSRVIDDPEIRTELLDILGLNHKVWDAITKEVAKKSMGEDVDSTVLQVEASQTKSIVYLSETAYRMAQRIEPSSKIAGVVTIRQCEYAVQILLIVVSAFLGNADGYFAKLLGPPTPDIRAVEASKMHGRKRHNHDDGSMVAGVVKQSADVETETGIAGPPRSLKRLRRKAGALADSDTEEPDYDPKAQSQKHKIRILKRTANTTARKQRFMTNADTSYENNGCDQGNDNEIGLTRRNDNGTKASASSPITGDEDRINQSNGLTEQVSRRRQSARLGMKRSLISFLESDDEVEASTIRSKPESVNKKSKFEAASSASSKSTAAPVISSSSEPPTSKNDSAILAVDSNPEPGRGTEQAPETSNPLFDAVRERKNQVIDFFQTITTKPSDTKSVPWQIVNRLENEGVFTEPRDWNKIIERYDQVHEQIVDTQWTRVAVSKAEYDLLWSVYAEEKRIKKLYEAQSAQSEKKREEEYEGRIESGIQEKLSERVQSEAEKIVAEEYSRLIQTVSNKLADDKTSLLQQGLADVRKDLANEYNDNKRKAKATERTYQAALQQRDNEIIELKEKLKRRDAEDKEKEAMLEDEREELCEFKHRAGQVVYGCYCQACCYLRKGGTIDWGKWGAARPEILVSTASGKRKVRVVAPG